MARKWLNLFTGAALSFAVAGNALADEGKITVFAAASLTNAMQDIATQYKKEKGVDVVSSFASSSTLARQIEAGAPADLFISADQKWMDYAVDKKAIDTASRQTLLGNSLVVVAPKASEQKDFTIDSKTNWTSLLNGGRLAVGDRTCPCWHLCERSTAKTGRMGYALPETGSGGRCSWRAGVGRTQ